MAAFLGNLRNVVIASFTLAILLVGLYCTTQGYDSLAFELFVLRFLHIVCGVMWIGLLWYFNFVQIPTMPKVPAELKGGVTGYIAPAALFWFRWAAVATVLLGLILVEIKHNGDAMRALSLDETKRTIGIGMWLGIVMALNVWLVIWPNQKRALGLVPADDARKARSASVAMMASRTNLILSLPMLYCMITGAHVG